MIILASFEGRQYSFPLDLQPSATSVQTLYDLVQQQADLSVGYHGVQVEIRHADIIIPRSSQRLSSYGFSSDSTVRVIISSAVQESETPVLRLISCEPAFGPVDGGTVVSVRGSGFHSGMSSLRVKFGALFVPAQVVSSTVLQCVSPAQAGAGLVSVHIHCNADLHLNAGKALFEYFRLENLYDAIFATTNANCPVRQVYDDLVDASNAGAGISDGKRHTEHQPTDFDQKHLSK